MNWSWHLAQKHFGNGHLANTMFVGHIIETFIGSKMIWTISIWPTQFFWSKKLSPCHLVNSQCINRTLLCVYGLKGCRANGIRPKEAELQNLSPWIRERLVKKSKRKKKIGPPLTMLRLLAGRHFIFCSFQIVEGVPMEENQL